MVVVLLVAFVLQITAMAAVHLPFTLNFSMEEDLRLSDDEDEPELQQPFSITGTSI